MKRLIPSLLAALAGAIYPLGFAPFSFWPVAIISLAAFIVILLKSQAVPPQFGPLQFGIAKVNRARAAWLGFVYGLGLFGVGVSWIYISMVNFGNMPPVLAIVAVALFVAVLAFFTGLFAFFAVAARSKFQLLLLVPALWVVSEALRGWVLTGLPWILLGYASIDSPLASFAPVAGVMGSSFILAALAGAIALLAIDRSQWRASLLVFVGIGLSSVVLNKIRWSQPTGKTLSVSMVQQNISLAQKWQPGQAEVIRQAYLHASQSIAKADLIVWPEAALPQLLSQVPESYFTQANDLPGRLALGGVEAVNNAEGERQLFNSLMLLGDEQAGLSTQVYRKKHLVPYGEYFPLKWLLGGLMQKLQIPMSNFSSWQASQSPLNVKGVSLASTICYEDAFPEEWRHMAGQSGVLLNISEDAWFGDSLAPHQRLEMARFRALEMARPMIRVSNSGLSALIDANGRVDALSPQFEAAILQGQVQAHAGLTPYLRYGRWPLYALMMVIMVVSFLSGKRVQKGL